MSLRTPASRMPYSISLNCERGQQLAGSFAIAELGFAGCDGTLFEGCEDSG